MGLLVQLRGVFVTLSDIMGSITFEHQSWLVHTHYLSLSLSLSFIYLSICYLLHTMYNRRLCSRTSLTLTHTHNTHSSTVALCGQLFNFAHVQRGKEVLLLALPASLLPRPLLLTTTLQIEHTIRLLYGSPQRFAFTLTFLVETFFNFFCRGFSMEDCSSVDHLMSLLFHQLTPHPSHHHQSHKPHLLSVSPLTALVAAHR